MIPAVEVAGARVFLGDCRDVLKTLPDNSVDSVVTDPPYELGFMGKKWDSSGIAYDVTVWSECLRVLKPGGHVLAFGGSRTWHRLAVAVEDAGFELRDSIAWIYGSGFPKSLNVAKAIAGHKMFGSSSRQDIRKAVMGDDYELSVAAGMNGTQRSMTGIRSSPPEITAQMPIEAEAWQGWGTALKPAFEPVVVGRKPLVGTVAENVLQWGVGGLNIEGSRIATDDKFGGGSKATSGFVNGYEGDGWQPGSAQGRWPANVILDEVSAGLLDEQSGVSVSKVARRGLQTSGQAGGLAGENPNYNPDTNTVRGHGDTGGASRFFMWLRLLSVTGTRGWRSWRQKPLQR